MTPAKQPSFVMMGPCTSSHCLTALCLLLATLLRYRFLAVVRFMLIARFALHALLQCNSAVDDQTNMDIGIVSSAEYVNMCLPDIAIHQSFCSARSMSIAFMLQYVA